jgi:hypothetical protein
MAITQAQLAQAKSLLLDRLILRYPEMRDGLVRICVQFRKQGTAIQKEAASAILNDAYTLIHGVTPIGRHHFKHWVEGHLGLGDDQTAGVNAADFFEAEPATVT